MSYCFFFPLLVQQYPLSVRVGVWDVKEFVQTKSVRREVQTNGIRNYTNAKKEFSKIC